MGIIIKCKHTVYTFRRKNVESAFLLVHVHVPELWFPPTATNMLVRLIEDSKLAVNVKVAFLSVLVPVMDW